MHSSDNPYSPPKAALDGPAVDPVHQSTPHPVIAGIGDFYFGSFAIGAVFGLQSAATGRPANALLGLILAAALLASIIGYHSVFARRVSWSTPGERFAGRFLFGTIKLWRNPYGKSRLFLYFTLIVFLIVSGNYWDRVFDTGIDFPKWGVTCVYLLLLSIGMVRAGQGKGWFLFLLVPNLLMLGRLFIGTPTGDLPPEVTSEQVEYVTTFAIGMLVALTALLVVTAMVYRPRALFD